jgi:TolA-binding protein
MMAGTLAAALLVTVLVSTFARPRVDAPTPAGSLAAEASRRGGMIGDRMPTRRVLAGSLERALNLYRQSRYEKAVQCCESVIRHYGDTEILDHFLHVRANSLLKAGRKDEAAEALARLLLAYPYSRFAWDALQLLGRIDPPAAQRFGIAEEPGTDLDESAQEALASFTGAVWQVDALDRIARHYPEHPISPESVLALGTFRMGKSDLPAALRLFGQVTSRWPESEAAVKAQAKRVECYRRMKLLDRAAEECYAMLQEHPDNGLTADTAMELGNHWFSKGEFRKAAHWYDELVERFPSYALAENVHFRIGQCYEREKNFRQSAQTFEEFARERPESVLRSKALACGGDAYLKAQDLAQAVRLFQTCASQYPNTIEAYYARGILAQADGRSFPPGSAL